ncbi:MAG: hypothetical protein OXE42_12770 [Gammaproteobacteria bacterium]|nr:hypothetical protein [Gammaproteobacteria bacterium]
MQPHHQGPFVEGKKHGPWTIKWYYETITLEWEAQGSAAAGEQHGL